MDRAARNPFDLYTNERYPSFFKQFLRIIIYLMDWLKEGGSIDWIRT